MPLDDQRVRRTADDANRHVDRMQNELRSINNDIYRLGQDFRNDRRFSSDAYRLRDELSQLDRDLQRTRDRLRAIQRSAR